MASIALLEGRFLHRGLKQRENTGRKRVSQGKKMPVAKATFWLDRHDGDVAMRQLPLSYCGFIQ